MGRGVKAGRGERGRGDRLSDRGRCVGNVRSERERNTPPLLGSEKGRESHSDSCKAVRLGEGERDRESERETF